MIRGYEVPLADQIAILGEAGGDDRKPFLPGMRHHLDAKMTAARPRLVRLAMARGVVPDAIDDVVQETLLEAWQHLGRLRGLEQLDVWLDGICRNVCRRWQTRQQKSQARSISLTAIADDGDSGVEPAAFGPLDASLLDPAEALARQDLEALLDRALGHLSPENRRAIELYYLLEMPQREAALHWG